MPVRKGGKHQAALQREAAKRGETLPEQRPENQSLLSDPTYVDSSSENNDSDVEIVDAPSASGNSDPTTRTDNLGTKRKLRRENADLIPETATKIARTTAWRNEKGKTKKARAIAMQPSVASFFRKTTSFFNVSPERIQDTVNDTSKQQETHVARQEEEEEDRVIEIIGKRHASVHAAEVPDLRRVEVEPPMSMEAVNEVFNVPFTMQPPRAQADVDYADAAPPSMAMDVDILIDPFLLQLSDPAHHTAVFQQDSVPSSASPSQNASNITKTASTDASPSIAGTRAVDSASSADANASTAPEDEAGDESDVEAPPDKPHELHQRLDILIKAQQKKLKKKKSLVTDTTAANVLVDLEALCQYNDLRFKLARDIQGLQDRLRTCPRNAKHRIRVKIGKIRPAMDASFTVASRCGRGPHFARTLRSMASHLIKTGELSVRWQGKGAQHDSLLNNPAIKSAVQKWVRGLLPYDKGGFNGRMKPHKLRRYVNEFLLPEMKIEDTISETTAVQWLKKLGFSLSRVQKGVYVDGHERPDVVEARKEMINYMYTSVLPFCYTYEGPDCIEIAPTLPEGSKIHYPIFHDETCVHANDLDNFVWMQEGEQPLRSKSRGRIVHISDFILEHCGRLSLTADEIAEEMKLPARPSPPPPPGSIPEPPAEEPAPADTLAGKGKGKGSGKGTKKVPKPKKAPKEKNTRTATTEGRSFTQHDGEWIPPPPPAPFTRYRVHSFDARRIIYPGANYDPWWDMPQLIAQTKHAIEIFKAKYPDGVAVFISDCSSAHEAYASDALLAHKMNRGPGGKQPIMRDTVIPLTGEPQSMVFPADYEGLDKDGNLLVGRPKGLEQVLRERGLLSALEQKHGRGLVAICAKCKLSQASREAAIKAAKAMEDESVAMAGLNSRGISEMDTLDHTRAKDCCMQRVLSLEKDFQAEKPLLQLIIERAGHKCLFLPKFHCELNPIEMYWSQLKRRFRELADGTFPTAKKLVPQCLDAITTKNIRGYFRHCWRYMDAYKKGLNIKQAAYAVKKYTSHRRIPATIMMDVHIIMCGATG